MISIIIPYVRQRNIPNLIDLINKNAGIPCDQFEIIAEHDKDGIGCPRMVKKLVEKTKYDWVMFLGDDTEPQENFLKYAIEATQTLKDGWGLVSLNDGEILALHWLAHKKLLEFTTDGDFFYTGYKHTYCDNELMDIAMELGHCVYTPFSVVKHNHPILGGIDDEFYKKASLEQKKDRRLYYIRRTERLFKNGVRKVALAFPVTDERIPIQFFQTYIGLDKSCINTVLFPQFRHGEGYQDIADVRNNLVRQAYQEACTHIIFADTDQIYPSDTFSKLLGHNKPIVSALIHSRWPPFYPLPRRGSVGSYKNIHDDEIYSDKLIEIDAVGTGCLLVDMRIFSKLPEKPFQISEFNDRIVGEDIFFCNEVRQQGVKIYCDTSIQIDHLSTIAIEKRFSQLYKKLKGV